MRVRTGSLNAWRSPQDLGTCDMYRFVESLHGRLFKEGDMTGPVQYVMSNSKRKWRICRMALSTATLSIAGVSNLPSQF